MFLTKKSILKIVLIGTLYFLLGGVCIIFWSLFKTMGYSEKILLALGIVLYALIVPIIFSGWYAEGKGKLINLGNKLVRKELKPAQFIEHYDSLMNSNELVVKKPSIEVLQLIAISRDVLDNKEDALRTIEEIIATTDYQEKIDQIANELVEYATNGYKEDMKNRINIINDEKSDLFISIHMNIFQDSRVHGIHVFHQKNNIHPVLHIYFHDSTLEPLETDLTLTSDDP